jgi:CIC family chloride channel protein
MKLKRRGILFKEGREVNILRSLFVKDHISQDFSAFLNTERVGKIIDEAIGGKHHAFHIKDSEDNYVGCFSLNQLKKHFLQKELLDSFVIAQDLAVPDIHIGYEENLERAMEIFGREDVDEIAILKDQKFLGVVKRKDVIEAYNHEIAKREATSGLIQKLKFTHQTKTIDIGKGYRIMEIDAPPSFWNKSLKELNLRALHRIDILLIKRKYPPQTITIPSADEIILKGDLLILAGLEENIKKITNSGRKSETP